MEKQKEDVSKLIDGVGNEPSNQNQVPNYVEWMQKNVPKSDIYVEPKNKGKCKSGKCGNNTKTIIFVSIILFITMWAGYGLITFIENLCK